MRGSGVCWLMFLKFEERASFYATRFLTKTWAIPTQPINNYYELTQDNARPPERKQPRDPAQEPKGQTAPCVLTPHFHSQLISPTPFMPLNSLRPLKSLMLLNSLSPSVQMPYQS